MSAQGGQQTLAAACGLTASGRKRTVSVRKIHLIADIPPPPISL